jgi:hypothetical protein
MSKVSALTRLMRLVLLGICLSSSTASQTFANAIYTWTLTGAVTGSGILSTDGTGSVVIIASMTGDIDSSPINPGSPTIFGTSAWSTDNLLYLSSPLYLDSFGVALITASNTRYVIHSGLPNSNYLASYGGYTDPGIFDVNVPVEFAISAVPGPVAGAGFPGLIFASGGLIAWWRRSRRSDCAPS